MNETKRLANGDDVLDCFGAETSDGAERHTNCGGGTLAIRVTFAPARQYVCEPRPEAGNEQADEPGYRRRFLVETTYGP